MEEVDKTITALDGTIQNYGGKVINVAKIGRGVLAYEVNNFRDGFYASIIMELPEDKIVDLKRNLKLNENFIRANVLDKSKAKAVTVARWLEESNES